MACIKIIPSQIGKIILILMFLFWLAESKLNYYGLYSLPIGSTLLDVSESVDNLLIAFNNASSPTDTDIIQLNTASNTSMYIGRI